MLSTSAIGRAVRNAVARGDFTYDPQHNEQLHLPDGTRYGQTTHGRIYRRAPGALEVYVPTRDTFVRQQGLPQGEGPQWRRDFSEDVFVPGLQQDREAFAQACYDRSRRYFGPEPHIDHPGRSAWEAIKCQEIRDLYAISHGWVPHPNG